MKIFVKAKTKARKNKVEKVDEKNFIVWVKEAPERGKANEAVIKLLAGYFKAPKSQVRITRGLAGKNKAVEI